MTLRTVENPPGLWRRFVDDTCVVQWFEHRENILKHISSIEQSIKFTGQDTYPYSSMAFLDTVVTSEQNRTLSISVYRKPTHRYQYQHWDSHYI